MLNCVILYSCVHIGISTRSRGAVVDGKSMLLCMSVCLFMSKVDIGMAILLGAVVRGSLAHPISIWKTLLCNRFNICVHI